MRRLAVGVVALYLVFVSWGDAETIPLPEHPRPDFERQQWINLNGEWEFRFDDSVEYDQTIIVPFSWGAPLSGVKDHGDIGWYARAVEVPDAWADRRVFLVVGASDWKTAAWLAGELAGEHRGVIHPFLSSLPSLRNQGRCNGSSSGSTIHLMSSSWRESKDTVRREASGKHLI